MFEAILGKTCQHFWAMLVFKGLRSLVVNYSMGTQSDDRESDQIKMGANLAIEIVDGKADLRVRAIEG